MAVRKAPAPNGRPGFLRVDTVHLGDKGGRKGVYVVKRRTIAHKSADT